MPDPSYPVDLRGPDISGYRAGNTGIDYVTSFDSGNPGPHVMVSALVHGNELCGAITLDFLFRQNVRPQKGRLSLAFANIAAYESFDPEKPNASRFVDEDFNRVWSGTVLDGPRDSVELRRARELRPIVDTVDLLLDIHSMQHATPPLMMAGPLEKGRRLAREVALPEIVVTDPGHAAGTRLRDYAAFGDPDSERNALLIEGGQHWEKSSAEVALQTTLRFLLATDVVGPDFAAPHLAQNALPAQKFIEVTGPATIETDGFKFTQSYLGMEVIPQGGTVIGYDGDRPVVTPYDNCVLIMPSRRLRRGESAVRFGRYINAP